MNIELLETNRFIKENLKFLWNSLVDKVYIILVECENIDIKIKNYELYLHNYGINNFKFCIYDKSFITNNCFEPCIHHKIYEEANLEHLKNILIMEENCYFDTNKDNIRKILEELNLVKKKFIFQNKNIDLIYLGNLNKNRLRRKKNFLVPINYIEYHFCYIINLECRYKLYNNKEDLMNCYIISPLFVFFNNKNNVNDINNVNILQDNNEENLSLVDKLKKSENYNKVLENVKYYNPFKNKKLF